jgi:hypothetical protein
VGGGGYRRRLWGVDAGSSGTGGRPASSQAPAITAATAEIDSFRQRSMTALFALKNEA